MNTPYYGHGMQYESPQNAFPGIAASSFVPRSNMTSFSTSRNDSVSSLPSTMYPAYSTSGSFSHATMVPMPLSSHPGYVGETGLNFMGNGIELDVIPDGRMQQAHEDDIEDFSSFFNANREFEHSDERCRY
jgi:hypothetical protein